MTVESVETVAGRHRVTGLPTRFVTALGGRLSEKFGHERIVSTGALIATATPEMGRNENKRLRIQRVHVQLELGKTAAEIEHLDRVLAQFEEFCTVSMSVRQGIAIDIEVRDGAGAVLKG